MDWSAEGAATRFRTKLSGLTTELAASMSMMGLVRLYVEPSEKHASTHVPDDYQPVIDLVPEQVQRVRKDLRKPGYDVISVPL